MSRTSCFNRIVEYRTSRANSVADGERTPLLRGGEPITLHGTEVSEEPMFVSPRDSDGFSSVPTYGTLNSLREPPHNPANGSA